MSTIGQVTVNEAGDVAIPKSICEQAGLRPGAELIVEKNGAGEIRLRQAENGSAESSPEETTMGGEAELIEENGLLVIKGGADVDIISLIEQDREERMRKLMKGSGPEPAAQEQARLVYEGSVLVAQTEALEDITEFISRARETRLAALMEGITE